ncbi:MAG: hypothetical protein ACPGUV_05255 [Polyangiales bacterium]
MMFTKILLLKPDIGALRLARTAKKIGVDVHLLCPQSHPLRPVLAAEMDALVEVDEDIGAAPSAAVLRHALQQSGAQAVHVGCHDDVSARWRAALSALAVPVVGVPADHAGLHPWTLRDLAAQSDARLLPLCDDVAGEVPNSVAAAAGWRPVWCAPSTRLAGGLERDAQPPADAASAGLPQPEGGDAMTLPQGWWEWRPKGARRLEITLVRDAAGHCLLLPERDHSIHQQGRVYFSESPSPALIGRDDEVAMREHLWERSAALAAALEWVGVLSVQWLQPSTGELYFDSASTGLGSGHACSEAACGVDLAELELQVSAGATLSPGLTTLDASCHAMQVELQVGARGKAGGAAIEEIRWPPTIPGRTRSESVHLQPSTHVLQPGERIGLLCSTAPLRHRALLLMDRLLAAFALRPLACNRDALRRLLADVAFRAGQYDEDLRRWCSAEAMEQSA